MLKSQTLGKCCIVVNILDSHFYNTTRNLRKNIIQLSLASLHYIQLCTADTWVCPLKKFRKSNCLWHVSFIDIVIWAYYCTVFRLQCGYNALVVIYSRLFTEGKFQLVFSVITVPSQYLHSGCLLIRTKNADAVYGLYVITALKSWNLSLPSNMATLLM